MPILRRLNQAHFFRFFCCSFPSLPRLERLFEYLAVDSACAFAFALASAFAFALALKLYFGFGFGFGSSFDSGFGSSLN